MARHIQILCPCGERRFIEPAPYGTKTVKIGDVESTGPCDAEPQTVPCCGTYSYRVVWHYINRETGAVGHRRKRGRVRVHIGARATVQAFKAGKMCAGWSWMSDKAVRGKAGVARSDAERQAREGELNRLLRLNADGFKTLVEGRAINKETGKPQDQPSKDAHEARLLRDEINRIDVSGKTWIRFYAFPDKHVPKPDRGM